MHLVDSSALDKICSIGLKSFTFLKPLHISYDTNFSIEIFQENFK